MPGEEKYHFEKIKEGKVYSFEYIFKRYYQPLFYYANEILNSEDDAKDVIAEVFKNVWEKKSKINIEVSVSSYLYKAVYNRCLNSIRSKRNHTISGTAIYNDQIHPLLTEKDSEFPIAGIIKNEKIDIIRKAIDTLPDKCREIFILNRKFKMKYGEIARTLNLSENTVKAQIKIALHKLRKQLL